MLVTSVRNLPHTLGETRLVKLAHISTVPFSLRFVKGQPEYLRARDIDTIAISSPGEELDEFAASQQVDAFPVSMRRAISPLQDIVSIAKLIRLWRRERPDIVQAQTPKGGLLGMTSAWLARVPGSVYFIHGLTYMTSTGLQRWLLMASDRLSCILADRVFCVSHSIRDVAIQDGLVPPGKIVVFHGGSANGIDAKGRFNPDRFSDADRLRFRREYDIPEKAPIVLFVGRLVRDKGVEDLARAWTSIRQHAPDAVLVIVGPREERDTVSPEVLAALENDDRVVLTGGIPDPLHLYAIADVLVLPTYREGFPTVLLEAAAMRVPTVATDVPGCTDAIIDGATGTLVEVGNDARIAEAILRYLSDPQLCREHGVAARNRVLDEFAPERIWDATLDEYRSLLRSRGIDLSG